MHFKIISPELKSQRIAIMLECFSENKSINNFGTKIGRNKQDVINECAEDFLHSKERISIYVCNNEKYYFINATANFSFSDWINICGDTTKIPDMYILKIPEILFAA